MSHQVSTTPAGALVREAESITLLPALFALSDPGLAYHWAKAEAELQGSRIAQASGGEALEVVRLRPSATSTKA